ncbi:hypothetical protein NDU88_005790 [Pleurodeles waltl]|uniref:Uncharacterized protein n=1 Tax=Pleurodeles waltl TaxID=8319 RepID=A0AAV7UMR9_PLEWA|nr:hypothetical protein NDU88_005790 [Pleurodeles waltl]
MTTSQESFNELPRPSLRNRSAISYQRTELGTAQAKSRVQLDLGMLLMTHNNAEGTLKAPEMEGDKEVDQEEAISSAGAGATDSVIISNMTLDLVGESSSPSMPDLILSNTSTSEYACVLPCTPSPSPSNTQFNMQGAWYLSNGGMGEAGIRGAASIKLSQEVAHKETKDQLSQLNTHLTRLSTRLTQVEQRVSDFEDAGSQAESTIPQIQSELEDLQFKLDEMENRSRRSNLRFVRVPEEMEEASSITKVVSDLICNCILPESAKTVADLSIMRAHRVPFTRSANLKHTHTILVNFGDYRIKEQILSQAIKKKNFKSGDTFSFHVFSDMSIIAAHQRREFVTLIDDFKGLGAPAGIVQLSKHKVLHK